MDGAQDFCCRRSAGTAYEQLTGQWFPTKDKTIFCSNAGARAAPLLP
jgi:hypothetical protein